MVKTSKICLTSLCNEMIKRYRTSNILAATFMSTNTFVKWIFAWMGNMKIDFRKEARSYGANMSPESLLVKEHILEYPLRT